MITVSVGRLVRSSFVGVEPSEAPAVELPEYEPTSADLLAVELLDDEDLDEVLAAAATWCAYEQGRAERPRRSGVDVGQVDAARAGGAGVFEAVCAA